MKKQNTICWRAGIDVTLAVCFVYMSQLGLQSYMNIR